MDPDDHIADLREHLRRLDGAMTVERGTAEYMLGLAIAEHPASGDGSHREAIGHYAAALRVFDARRFPQHRARTFTALGASEMALGMKAIARERFEEALGLLAGSEAPIDVGAAANNLGLVAEDLGALVDAEAAFRDAIWHFATAGAQRQEASATHNLARVLALSGKRDEAAVAFGRAVTLTTAAGDGPLWAAHVHELANHLLAEEGAASAREAVNLLRQALTVFTRSHHPFQHAMAKYNLGLAHSKVAEQSPKPLNDHRLALVAFEDAVSIFDPRLHPDEWRAARQGLAAVASVLTEHSPGQDSAGHFVGLLASSQGPMRRALVNERLSRLWSLPEPARTDQVAALDRALVRVPAPGNVELAEVWIQFLTEHSFSQADAALALRVRTIAELPADDRHLAILGLEAAVGSLEVLIRMQVRTLLETAGYQRPDGVA